jgi:predicted site-specific integrase-resolvase
MEQDQPELPVGEAEERLSQWAKNQTELAAELGCARETIQRWLKAGDPDCPGKTSDGRYNVSLWKIWIETKGKKVRAAVKGRDKGALEMENMRLRNEKLQIENLLKQGELLHVDEVCGVLTEMMGAFVKKVRGMKHTLPNAVVGVSIPEATKRVDREAVEALLELSLGEWAKKKPFWSSVYARLQDLQRTHSLGSGLSDT